MRSNDSLALLRRSLELIQESQNLRWRAREAIAATTLIVGRSKTLLSARTVDRVQALQRIGPRTSPQVDAKETPSRSRAAEPKPSPDAETTLERIAEIDFLDQTVSLDGRHFVDCTLSRCVLEYSGGPCILEGTHFTDCRFLFGNEAAMTVAILECFGLVDEHVARATLPPPGSTAAKLRVN